VSKSEREGKYEARVKNLFIYFLAFALRPTTGLVMALVSHGSRRRSIMYVCYFRL
jgi:hypothetical protein